jgi:hypothetical protein
MKCRRGLKKVVEEHERVPRKNPKVNLATPNNRFKNFHRGALFL